MKELSVMMFEGVFEGGVGGSKRDDLMVDGKLWEEEGGLMAPGKRKDPPNKTKRAPPFYSSDSSPLHSSGRGGGGRDFLSW